MPERLARRPGLRIACAVTDLFTAGLIVFGVFVALPSRWAPVDAVAVGLATLEIVSGCALLAGRRWAHPVALVAASVAFLVGLLAVSALTLTASWLGGVYGPVGRGGALVLVLVAALVFPYLVVFPALKLAWLGRASKEKHSPEGPR